VLRLYKSPQAERHDRSWEHCDWYYGLFLYFVLIFVANSDISAGRQVTLILFSQQSMKVMLEQEDHIKYLLDINLFVIR